MSNSQIVSIDQSVKHGGMPARRAIIRWAWRMYRRQWRQQVIVLILLTLAIGAAIFGSTAAYNIAPVPGNAEFGSANHFIEFNVADAHYLETVIARANEHFGTIDVVTYRAVRVEIPGLVETIVFRSQVPNGPFNAPMLDLYDGRYPSVSDEVALTDGLSEKFGVEVGGTLATDDGMFRVVGIVENPSDLTDEFALVMPDHHAPPDRAIILVSTDNDVVDSFAMVNEVGIGSRPRHEGLLAAVTVMGVSTLALLLIALVASASFMVLAQRRLRQLGMLAAIGATERHLRLVIAANGAIVGLVAAGIGAVMGVMSWILVVPSAESAFGHRIEVFNVPWWLVGLGMTLAVVSAVGAAWWPGRTVARVPVTRALSGRPPHRTPTHSASGIAVILIAVGIACLVLADQTHVILIILGIAATIIGMLLLSPLAIQMVASTASTYPFAIRLAVRDLARYRDRSAVALAAISLALGIASAIVIIASTGEGNLADNQLLIWTRNPDDPDGVSPFFTEDPSDSGFSPFIPDWTPTDIEALETTVGQIGVLFDDYVVTPLDVAVDPGMEPDPRFSGRQAITLAKYSAEGDRDGWQDVTLVYIATPELLGLYGVDFERVDGGVALLSVETDSLRYVGMARNRETGRFDVKPVENLQHLERLYTSVPGSLMMPTALDGYGWETARVGWLIQTRRPFTAEQIAKAREFAAQSDMLIEARYQNEGLLALRWQATIVGMVVALAVLCMTVGLIRGEGVNDLRILAATGATSAIRRSLTATTAGVLAFLGAVIGMCGAYLGLIAGYSSDIFTPISLLYLSCIAIGVPLLAAVGGWLLSGREPHELARPTME